MAAFGLLCFSSVPPQAQAESTRSACVRDKVIVIAHRGIGVGTRTINGHRYTEDTIPAFRFAMRVGADGYETDYLPSKDSRIISNHDDTLERTSNGSGRIASRTMRYIGGIRADSGALVSTFNQVERSMASFGGQRQQELRSSAFTTEQLRRMIRMDYRYLARPSRQVLFTASEMKTLRRVNEINSNIQVGYINRGSGRPSLSNIPAFVDVIMIDHQSVTAQYVTAAHRKGLQISARSVNTANQLRRVAAAGVDRVVTDYPGLINATC